MMHHLGFPMPVMFSQYAWAGLMFNGCPRQSSLVLACNVSVLSIYAISIVVPRSDLLRYGNNAWIA